MCLLTEAQQSFKLKGCSNFLFPNQGAMGYYRYDYDSAALRAIGPAVEQGLSPEERISLVGDDWALMRAGLHGVGDYLALGAQLKNTPGYVLLENFLDHVEYVSKDMCDCGGPSGVPGLAGAVFLAAPAGVGLRGTAERYSGTKAKAGSLVLRAGNDRR